MASVAIEKRAGRILHIPKKSDAREIWEMPHPLPSGWARERGNAAPSVKQRP
jgi:hypothetical protein